MKQVLIIHGGTTFSTYEKYLETLQTKTIRLELLKGVDTWRDTLQDDLGSEYEVLQPSMPNRTNAVYEEWAIWFERITELLNDDCVLIGHSLGSIFLVKYLSENKLPIKVNGTFLIGTPYDDESIEDLTDFKLNGVAPLFTEQAGKVVLINGPDDPVISISDIEKMHVAIPSAEYILTSAPDHFMRPHLPMLVERILTL